MGEPTKQTKSVIALGIRNGDHEKRALKYFEKIRYIVHKKLCRLQFPDFPEGNSGKSFRSVYESNEMLKSGSHGYVYRGRHRETKKK